MSKKIFFSLIFFIMILFLSIKVQANTISSIDMDVFINSDGSANIEEKWNTNLDSGTEGYRTYKNLDKMEITNFSVSDENENVYKTLDSWNTGDTFNQKAYKCGLNKIYNGVELCWGISEYGNHTYTLTYNISNFVTQYTDIQGIYFNFINLDFDVNNVTIKLNSDIRFSLDNSKIWSFGNGGNISFDPSDGSILFKSNGKLKANQYVVELIRFEDNYFNVQNSSTVSFDEIFDEAFANIEKYSYDEDNYNIPILGDFLKKLDDFESRLQETESTEDIVELFKTIEFKKLSVIIIIVALIGIFFVIMINPVFWLIKTGKFPHIVSNNIFNNIIKIIAFIVSFFGMAFFPLWIAGWIYLIAVSNTKVTVLTEYKLDFDAYTNDVPDIKNVNYFKEIPCRKDLTELFWYLVNYKIEKNSVLKRGVLGAYLLKWIKDGKIIVSKTNGGLFNFKDNNYAIDFREKTKFDSEAETKLYNILLEASGKNGILEAKEFEKWCKKNYKVLLDWFDIVEKQGAENLVKDGYLKEEVSEKIGFLGIKKNIIKRIVTNKVDDEVENIIGFKKYLLEYSLINKREFIEVHIWEEFLIFAELLGIAKKVRNQFSKLYPKFKDESYIFKLLEDDVDNFDVIDKMAEIGYVTANAAYKESIKKTSNYTTNTTHDYSGSSRDTGGGGSSYSSGGESSGGASGGGFR